MTKVDFLFCGRKGFDTLQHHVKLHGSLSVNQVVTYADKAVLNDPFDEVVQFCKQHSIQVVDKKSYTESEYYRIVIGWQRMLATDGKTIVLHDSLLPKYRGFAPLVNSLCNGENEIGVTAILASDKYDEGPVIVQKHKTISYPITILQAIEIITPLYFEICDHVFEAISKGHIYSSPQNHKAATYSLWRDEKDYLIDWSQPAEVIRRFIDAVGFPYQGAATTCNGEKVFILSAEEVDDVVIEKRTPGKIIFLQEGHPVIVCGKGLLLIRIAYDVNHDSIIPIKKFRSRFQ